jgi:hypothetical protein
MDLEYNTSRSRMLMPEYGRNVQRMVEFIMTVEDPEKRLRNAEMIIDLMGTLNPHLKVIEDYKHKLWDHLYQMTDFKLDVASPYPPPTPESVFKKPEVIPYPQTKVPHRHLGKNLEALIQKALAEQEPEKKRGFTQAVGYYMKLAYTNWHKEPVHDDMIKNELRELTGGQLIYETGGYRVHFDNNRPASNNFKRNNNSNNNNRNFKSNDNRNPNPNQRNAQGGNVNSINAPAGNNYGNTGFNKNRKFNKNKPKP